MNNREVARLFREVAAAYVAKGEDWFKVRAYDEAADAIERAGSEVRDLWEQGKVSEIPGIGKALSEHIDELMRTGKVGHFEQAFRNLPKGMFPLLDITGIGPKTAYTLAKQLRLTKEETAVSKLKEAIEKEKVAKIEGFGEDSQQKFLKAIGEFERREDRMLLPVATELAERVAAHLTNSLGKDVRIVPLGSLRRRCATVGDVDIAVATTDSVRAIEAFTSFPEWREVLASGTISARAIHRSGRQVDLKIEPPERFGSLLQHFTGSKEHNVTLRELALTKGYSVSEHGVKKITNVQRHKSTNKEEDKKINRRIDHSINGQLKTFNTEEEFYGFLGLKWIPPELRENRGEIEAALLLTKRRDHGKPNGLPRLVELSDIRGEFHIHSNFNIEPSHDLGTSSLADLVATAKNKGYEYIAISDHNPSVSRHTERQIVDLVKKRNDAINRFVERNKLTVHIFKSMEIDILPDGRRALPDEALELLDFAIVSIHSNFSENPAAQTTRVLRALDHPKVRIFGHPTSRQLLAREGVDYDWEKVFSFCKERHIFMEINANPQRLDLPDMLIKEAIGHGVKLVINTDSHAADHLSFMRFGVDMARRGWAEKKDIVNTLGYNEVARMLRHPGAER